MLSLDYKYNKLEQIYNAIKEDIRNHPDINLSILGMVPDWQRSQYVILADLISDHLSKSSLLTHARKLNLGTTISPITLQRFFENEYQVKTHNDLRFIKTLDKICIFLGKYDLNTYIHEHLYKIDDTISTNQTDSFFFEKDLVIEYCKSQYEALIDLPSIDLNKVSRVLCKGSPLFERIRCYFEEKKKNHLVFITENNRSNYEIFEVKKISDEPDLKVIQTQEFWNLVFQDHEENTFVVHHLNTQLYFIKKIDNEWKIWDNYNPDYNKILKIN